MAKSYSFEDIIGILGTLNEGSVLSRDSAFVCMAAREMLALQRATLQQADKAFEHFMRFATNEIMEGGKLSDDKIEAINTIVAEYFSFDFVAEALKMLGDETV